MYENGIKNIRNESIETTTHLFGLQAVVLPNEPNLPELGKRLQFKKNIMNNSKLSTNLIPSHSHYRYQLKWIAK